MAKVVENVDIYIEYMQFLANTRDNIHDKFTYCKPSQIKHLG